MGKYIITNGSFKPLHTLEELLKRFDVESVIRAAQKISLELERSKNNYKLPSDEELQGSPQKWLAKLWKLNEEIIAERTIAEKREEDQKRHFNQGVEYWKATELACLQTPPKITFSPYQILGFLEMAKGFGGFFAKEMQEVVRGIEALNLRADYGVSNRNNGNEIISWLAGGDCTTLQFHKTGKENEEFLALHEENISAVLRIAAPDTVEIQAEDWCLSFVMRWN